MLPLCSSLLFLELLEVELELFALKNVSVEATALAWAGGDASKETSRGELVGNLLIDGAGLLSASKSGCNVFGSLNAFTSFIRFFKLLLVELHVVLLEVPLSEWGGINVHNGVLNEDLHANELVVGGVVNNINHTGLKSNSLRSPGPGAVIIAQGSLLHVSASATDEDDLLGTELGHSWDSAHLELSLFLVDWHTATSGSPLLPGVPRNTHTS